MFITPDGLKLAPKRNQSGGGDATAALNAPAPSFDPRRSSGSLVRDEGRGEVSQPYSSSPSTLEGGRGAAHCAGSFPGSQNPALVCDQIPGLTKPGFSPPPPRLPGRRAAVRAPSGITSLRRAPPLPRLSLFSRWDLLR